MGEHLPGGRGSRRPWPCSGGSAAQTAAQVSLETPAGADQGQAQPGTPAKSGSGHGRPVLCGGKRPWRWGPRRMVFPSPPTPSLPSRPPGCDVSSAPAPPHPSATGWSLLRGEALPSRPCPARGVLRYLSQGSPAAPPPAPERVPSPYPGVRSPPQPARWRRTARLPLLGSAAPPEQRGSEQRYARKAAEFPASPWEILGS